MNKRGFVRSLLCALTLGGLLAGCAVRTEAPRVQTIDAAHAKRMIDSGAPLAIIDVRELGEFEALHIPGALLLPVGDIPAKAEALLPDKDMTLLIYCRSGNRSAHAAAQLISMGYRNVYDFGGIIDWPYETQ